MFDIQSRILAICNQIQEEKKYHSIWQDYCQTYEELYSWMDTLPEEDWHRINDHMEAFFDIHMKMMEIALTQK